MALGTHIKKTYKIYREPEARAHVTTDDFPAELSDKHHPFYSQLGGEKKEKKWVSFEKEGSMLQML